MNLVVSQFHFAQSLTAAEEKMMAVIPIKTYWTFVVRAIIPVSRFQPDRQTERISGGETAQYAKTTSVGRLAHSQRFQTERGPQLTAKNVESDFGFRTTGWSVTITVVPGFISSATF
jgi:hypothetical protein